MRIYFGHVIAYLIHFLFWKWKIKRNKALATLTMFSLKSWETWCLLFIIWVGHLVHLVYNNLMGWYTKMKSLRFYIFPSEKASSDTVNYLSYFMGSTCITATHLWKQQYQPTVNQGSLPFKVTDDPLLKQLIKITSPSKRCFRVFRHISLFLLV